MRRLVLAERATVALVSACQSIVYGINGLDPFKTVFSLLH
jgi:hypothetical protein